MKKFLCTSCPLTERLFSTSLALQHGSLQPRVSIYMSRTMVNQWMEFRYHSFKLGVHSTVYIRIAYELIKFLRSHQMDCVTSPISLASNYTYLDSKHIVLSELAKNFMIPFVGFEKSTSGLYPTRSEHNFKNCSESFEFHYWRERPHTFSPCIRNNLKIPNHKRQSAFTRATNGHAISSTNGDECYCCRSKSGICTFKEHPTSFRSKL